ncbi:unnamed protein product [Cunninghamella blakesleeana]
MKYGVKLHNYHSKGRIDTYQLKRSPYTTDYTQACQILQAIKMNNQQRLSHSCLLHLSTFVSKSWEEHPTQEKVKEIYQYFNYLLDSSSMNEEKESSLDDKIRKFCQNDTSIPTVCPSTTLIFAIHYIDKLKQKYKDVTGTNGCSKRLILVAFMIASKYIHSNLKIIVDISLKKSDNDITSPSSILSPKKDNQHLSLPQLPLSPPTSPKPITPKIHSTLLKYNNNEITDPLQYHYFKSSSSSSSSASSLPSSPKLNTMLLPPTSPQSIITTLPPNIKDIKTMMDDDPNNNDIHPHHHNNTLPSLSSQLNYRIWRMEMEFLHFLNNNIKIFNCIRLIEWAQQI